MSTQPEILVLDDESIVCERLREYLQKNDYRVETFTDSGEAITRLAEKDFDLVISDLKMKAPTGLDILHFVRNNSPGTQVIIITGFASMEAAREAEYGNVYDFITKPFQMEKLGAIVRKAVKKTRKLRGRENR